MSGKNNDMRDWSERLEEGKRDDERLEIAARLENARLDESATPSIEFRRQLRRDLLNQYETTTGNQPGRFRRFAGSAMALSVLAALVVISWLTMSSIGRPSFGGAPAQQVTATLQVVEQSAISTAPVVETVPELTPTPEIPPSSLYVKTPKPFSDALTVLSVSPAAGSTLTGTQPITFEIEIDYTLSSVPIALLEVTITEGSIEAGRGIASAQVTLNAPAGKVSVPVILNPSQELNNPAELGLWLQIKPGADASLARPILIEMPEAIRWHFKP